MFGNFHLTFTQEFAGSIPVYRAKIFMDRRSFLKSLAGAVGAKALVPLVVPETIFLKARSIGATYTVTLPKPGQYPIEITCDDWFWVPLKLSEEQHKKLREKGTLLSE